MNYTRPTPLAEKVKIFYTRPSVSIPKSFSICFPIRDRHIILEKNSLSIRDRHIILEKNKDFLYATSITNQKKNKVFLYATSITYQKK